MTVFKFTRQPLGSNWYYPTTGFLAFAGITAYCFFAKTGLRYKRIHLEYTTSLYVFGALALIMALWMAYSLKSDAKAKGLAQANPDAKDIMAADDHFSFYDKKFQPVTLKYDTVYELWLKTGDDDDKIILWYDNRPGGHQAHEFFKENFANETDYNNFHDLLSRKCVNITNR